METDEGDTMKKTKKQTALPSDLGEPNKTLFAEDLPEATNANMLGVLFRQFPGFVEARMVPGKPGISFIEFESDQQAGVALNGLQGFRITPQNQIKLSYAKKQGSLPATHIYSVPIQVEKNFLLGNEGF